MAADASSLGDFLFLRTLFLGIPKVGKTCNIILSSHKAFGGGYVIGCSTKEHLRQAMNLSKTTHKEPWQFDIIKNVDDMGAAIGTARKGVKEGRYKWVFVDDFNLFAGVVEETFAAANKDFGPTFWRQYRQHLLNVCLRLFDLKAHVMVAMH